MEWEKKREGKGKDESYKTFQKVDSERLQRIRSRNLLTLDTLVQHVKFMSEAYGYDLNTNCKDGLMVVTPVRTEELLKANANASATRWNDVTHRHAE